MNRLSFRTDGNQDEFSWGRNKSLVTGKTTIYQVKVPEYSGILPKEKKSQNKERIGPIMTRTLGTSRSVQEELIASFESILPGVVDKVLERNAWVECANKSSLNDRLIILAKRAPIDVLTSLTPDEMERRVEKILALEFAISAFGELSVEQRKILEE
jgi:hypothetical protein